MDFMDWDNYFVFYPKDSRSKSYVEVYNDIVSILNFESRCSSSAGDSMVGPNIVVLLRLLRFLLNSEDQIC